MPRLSPWLGWLLLLTMATAAVAQASPPANERKALEVFVRDGCPHCAAAKAYLPTFAAVHPDLHIVVRSLDDDPGAREDLIRHFRDAGIWPPGVPTFVFAGRMLIGFEDAASTGPALAALINPGSPPSERVETKWFGTLSVSRLGLPGFTLALGLLDGFNPCAMWVLLVLLSLLVRLHNRRRMAIVAGTFVLVSAMVYYAFMAAWLNVFLLIGMSVALRMGLGGIALLIGAINLRDALRREQQYLISIPGSAKPGLYARMRQVIHADTMAMSLAGVAILAIVVNFVELLCTAGFPAIYTAVLTQQGLSPLTHYAYLGLYNLAYIADDVLMVTLAVVFLSSPRISLAAGRWLKFLSGGMMLALGLVMLARPSWLF